MTQLAEGERKTTVDRRGTSSRACTASLWRWLGGAVTGEGDQRPGRPAASLYSLTPGWGRDWVAGPATSASRDSRR